jgi:hypothetical protein
MNGRKASCPRLLTRVRGRSLPITPAHGVESGFEDTGVGFSKRHERAAKIDGPCLLVREALETLDKRRQFGPLTQLGKTLDAQWDLDRKCSTAESDGTRPLTRHGGDPSNPDEPTAIAGRIVETAARGVEEEPVTRRQALCLSPAMETDSRPLFGDDPREWLTVCDRQEIVGQRLTLSQ